MMPSLRTATVSIGLLLAVGLGACNRAPPTPGLARGQELFDTCVPCHGAEGHGNRELGAPNIAGLPQWYVEAQLRKFQQGHRGANPFDTVGIRMKSMSLALDLDGDLESVAQYVASMTRAPSTPVLEGDAQAGQASYQVCVACHGPSGLGIEAVNSPPLVGQADWYLLAQLEKFKKGWRGTNPEDISGATMRPNAMVLDETAMANVIAYIQTLQ
jgi:cytochrome c oxidase subunit 2